MARSRGDRRLSARRREGARVAPLELFFDLVFVLAITQCSSLMGSRQDWAGIAQGLLVLALLWWSWVGYAWLTSVVDPDDGLTRLVVLGAMAALLVAALCVPQAFGGLALGFALAYGAVRFAHIALFAVASRDDPALRRSVAGLAVSTTIGVALIVTASFFDHALQAGLWIAALALDMGGPYIFGSEGWKLEPAHFVERHELVVIIALGESIVVLGVGSDVGVTGPVLAAAVLGIALVSGLWWLYFEAGSREAAHRLETAPPGREMNELARDAYSYLHFPMVAGIVLVALGLGNTLAGVDDPLDYPAAGALAGGLAFYLLGLVAFRLRATGKVEVPKVVLGVVLVGTIPVAHAVDAWTSLAAAVAVTWLLIAFDRIRAGTR